MTPVIWLDGFVDRDFALVVFDGACGSMGK